MREKRKTRFAERVLAMSLAVMMSFTSIMGSGTSVYATEDDTSLDTNLSDSDFESLNDSGERADAVEFNHFFDTGLDSESLKSEDFSSCELLAVADASVFTSNTEVVSEYGGVYLLRFATPEETMYAYSYYYDKTEMLDINTVLFHVSDGEEETTSIAMTDDNESDALSEASVLEKKTYPSAIALIDTGCEGNNVVDTVSVLGGDVKDDNGHGQKMYDAIVGEYQDAEILSIKALGSDGSAYASDVYAAVMYAIESKVKVINLSMSAIATQKSEIVETAIEMATDNGILVTSSAGNNGKNAKYYTPARMECVYVAGACNITGERLSFSNYGDSVDYNIVADSTSKASAILAAMLARDGVDGLDLNNGKIFETDYIKEDLPKDDDNYLDIVDSLDANFLVNGYFDDNKGFVVADHYHGKVNGITASLYHLLVYNAQGKVESSVLGYCCQHSQSGDMNKGDNLKTDCYIGKAAFPNDVTRRNIAKALLWANTAPDPKWDGFDDYGGDDDRAKHDDGVVALTCSYYNGDSVSTISKLPDVTAYRNFLANQTIFLEEDDQTASLSSNSQEASDSENGMMKSKPMNLTCVQGMTYSFIVPNNCKVYLYSGANGTGNKSEYESGSRVSVGNGQSICLLANSSLAGQTTTIGGIQSDQPIYQVAKFVVNDSRKSSFQNVACVGYGSKKSINLSVKWSTFPFTITKKAASVSIPTATYVNGVKTANGTCTLNDIASVYSQSYGILPDARFTAWKRGDVAHTPIQVYLDQGCTIPATNGQLTVGVTYYTKEKSITVSETTAPKGWSHKTADGQDYFVSLDLDGSVKSFDFEDMFSGDPFKMQIAKKDKAETKVKDALFTLTNNDTGEKWVYKSDSNGVIYFSNPDYLYNGKVYLNALTGEVQFYLGNYTLSETTPADGYLPSGSYAIIKDGQVIKQSTDFNGKILDFDVVSTNDGQGNAQVSIDNVIIAANATVDLQMEENCKMMGFKVQKNNKDTNTNATEGGMIDYTTNFDLVYVGRYKTGNDNDDTTWYDKNLNGKKDDGEVYRKGDVIGNFTTDKNGFFELNGKYLQMGTYKVVEKTAPNGMIRDSIFDTTEVYFPNSDGLKDKSTSWTTLGDGYINDLTSERSLVNSMARGGVAGYKYDAESLTPSALAGSVFDGINIYVRNDNQSVVMLDENGDGIGEKALKPGEKYKVFTLSNGSAVYSSNPTLLPYGKYSLLEDGGTNLDYLIGDKLSKEGIPFEITDNMQYFILALNNADIEAIKNYVNTNYASQIAEIKKHLVDGKAREIQYNSLGNDIASMIANHSSKHGVAIVKYDTDDYDNAKASLDVKNGYYPEAQGDATLQGAVYKIYNRNNGEIMIDTDGDHNGDKKVAKDGECITLTTKYDEAEGIEYASTSATLLPNGNYEIIEVTPSVGYLKSGNISQPYTATKDGQYFIFVASEKAEKKIENIVNRENPIKVFDEHQHNITFVPKYEQKLTDDVARGKLTIKKNDAERAEHTMNGVIASESSDYGKISNDNESKYAQGDASLEKAVYKVYNISDHYVYTIGSNDGTTRTRVETGKNTFKNLTGIDVDTLTFKSCIYNEKLSNIIDDEMMSKIQESLSNNVCYTLTTDKNGVASTVDNALPYGTYLVMEYTPSKGYLATTERDGETAKIIRIRNNGDTANLTYDKSNLNKTFFEAVIRGGFEVYKYDEESKMNVPLNSANLEGKFEVINRSKDYVWVDTNENGIYEDSECYAPGSVVYTFKTDAKTGKFVSKNNLLPYGTYEIHETYPPKGYLHLSNINPNTSVFFEIREEDKIVSDGWYFDKDGTKVTSTTHYAPIENAYNEDGTRITQEELVGEAKEVTDARLIIYNFVVRGDIFFEKKSAMTMKAMPYTPFLMTSYDENGNPIESHVIFTDQNGDFNTSAKYVDHTYNTNAGDEMYDWLMKYSNAYENEDEDTIASMDAEYAKLVEKYKAGVGTWFGLNTKVSDDLGRKGTLTNELNAVGALPFGTYTIEELRCPYNKGYKMVTDTVVVDSDAADTTADIDPEGYKSHAMHSTVNMGTIYNSASGISTVALTQDEQSHYSNAYGDMVIIDKVSYENIVPGRNYKLVAELRDADTGDVLYDAWGKEVRVEKEFVPTLATDSIDMNLEFDASDYKNGGTVVVFEYLYDIEISTDDPVAYEEDLTNPDQQIHFPKIDSELTEEKTGLHVIKSNPTEDQVWVDTISYENLEPGQTYVIGGYLIDKEKVDYAEDDYKDHITADIYDFEDSRMSYNKSNEIIFKPTEKDGTFKLKYTFSATKMEDKAYVSFVEVRKNRNVIASHMEIEDENQTVYIPKITTKAYDFKTETQLSFAETNETIVDTVSYSNVAPNVEYTINGVLMNKKTGKVAVDKDGKEITETKTFTPTTSSGDIDVVFKFNGTDMENTTLVAYETLCVNGNYELCYHKEMDDKNQTIYIPKIETKARDSVNATQMVNPDTKEISITDTISYYNLIPKEEYQLVGKLVDLDTKETLLDKDGNPITSTVNFVPAKADGEKEVTFTFEGYEKLEGKTTVVFEEMYIVVSGGKLTEDDAEDSSTTEDASNDTSETTTEETTEDGDHNLDVDDDDIKPNPSDNDFEEIGGNDEPLVIKKIAQECNLENKNQTIYFPELHTTAYDGTIGINMTKASEAKVIDTVAYYNLVGGMEFTIKGKLVDKETGEVIKVDGKEVTATKTFTADDKMYGAVDVEFTFDATKLAGKTLVAYEELYVGDFLLKSHTKIDDEAETIYIPKIGTTAKDSETKDHIANADGSVEITDTVKYENLVPGREYIIVGQMMNKNTKEAVELTNGEDFDESTLDHPLSTEIIVSDRVKNLLSDEEKNNLLISMQSDNEGNTPLDGLDESDTEFDDETKSDLEDTDNKGDLTEQEKDLAQIKDVAEKLYNGEGTFSNLDTLVKAYAVKYPDSEIAKSLAPFMNDLIDASNVLDLYIANYKKVQELLKKDDTDDSKKDDETDEPQTKGYYIVKKFVPTEADGSVELTFKFNGTDMDGISVVAFEELYVNGYSVAEHKELSDEGQTVHLPKIRTTAVNKKNNTHYSEAEKEVTIVDTVKYENVLKGKKYNVTGVLMDRDAGVPIYKDAETKEPVTATATFTAESENGTADVEFTFDASLYEGVTVVAFEDLYYNGVKVGTHSDLSDEEQAVHIVKIGTTATDKFTMDHVLKHGKTEIIDTVSYKGLVPGTEYVLSATLMDKETGKPYSDKSVSEIKFTPDASEGKVEVSFTFDTDKLDGKTLVVFEKLYFEGINIANHEDIKDEGQTLYIPKIGTSASDSKTKESIMLAEEEAKLIDTVKYENLLPGREYVIIGQLVRKSDGSAVEIYDGLTKKELPVADATMSDATATDATMSDATNTDAQPRAVGQYVIKKFVPETSDGSVDITFRFDSSKIDGDCVVAFEEIYLNGYCVAEHKDIKDEGQTVKLPKVETSVKNNADDTHYTEAVENVTITDAVKYSNVIKGKEYTVTGVLMDKETKEPLLDKDGKQITSSVTFIAEEENGSVDVGFTFDASLLAGKTVVVFEDLYYNGKKVGSHADINDEDQSIHVVEIKTTATDKNTKTHVAANGKTIIVDKVSYKGLIPGQEYVISGKLMDKETGKELVKGDKSSKIETLVDSVTGKTNEYISEIKFVPTKSEGTVDIKFEVDTTGLESKTLVVFEKLYNEGKNIANHEDIEDKDQTIYVPKIGTTAIDKLTSTKNTVLGDKTVIVDTVKYENLVPRETYTIEGILMDKSTKKALSKDKKADTKLVSTDSVKNTETKIQTKTEEWNGISITMPETIGCHNSFGNRVKATYELKEVPDGKYYSLTVNMTVTQWDSNRTNFGAYVDVLDENGNAINSDTFIYFKNDNGVKVGDTYTDTVSIPLNTKKIVFKENATNATETEKLGLTTTESVTTENVTTQATTEEIKATDSDAINTDALKENAREGSVATATFTPEKESGSIDVEFVIDTKDLAGTTLVAYEYLKLNGKTVAKHEDINDEDQSVYAAKIGTKATVDGKKTAQVNAETTIVDTVEYTNLIPGQEYTVKGVLMDKKTNQSIGVTAETTFKAEKSDGSVEVTFKADTTKYESLVVFEDLYIGGNLVAQHADINDEDQTVTFTKETPPDEKVKTGAGILVAILMGLALGFGGAGIYTLRRKKKFF